MKEYDYIEYIYIVLMLPYFSWIELTCPPLIWQTLITVLIVIKLLIEWINFIENRHIVSGRVNSCRQ